MVGNSVAGERIVVTLPQGTRQGRNPSRAERAGDRRAAARTAIRRIDADRLAWSCGETSNRAAARDAAFCWAAFITALSSCFCGPGASQRLFHRFRRCSRERCKLRTAQHRRNRRRFAIEHAQNQSNCTKYGAIAADHEDRIVARSTCGFRAATTCRESLISPAKPLRRALCRNGRIHIGCTVEGHTGKARAAASAFSRPPSTSSAAGLPPARV